MNNKPIRYDGGQLVHHTEVPRANTLYNRIQEFLETQFAGMRPATVRNNRTYLEQFEHYVGSKPLTPQLVNGYANWLESRNKFGPQTMRDNMVRVKRFLRWAHLMEYVAKDLSHHMAKMAVPKLPVHLIFSQSEYELLRDEAEGTRFHFAIICSYYTGMDLVDICFLRWTSVDMEAMLITYNRLKMNRMGQEAVAEVPIITDSDLHIALLERVKDRQPPPDGDEDWVCPELARDYSWADSNINQSFWRFIKRYCPNKSFKTFRRTFCSNLANSGVNLTLACRMTAHSDPKTFLRYVKHETEAMRGGLEKALEYAQTKKQQPNHSKTESRRGDLPKDEPPQTKTESKTCPVPAFKPDPED